MEFIAKEQIFYFKPNNSISSKFTKANCNSCSISKFCLPSGLNNSDMAILDNMIKHRRLVHKGESIYKYGEKSDCIYAIRSGSVKTLTPIKYGEEQVLGFHLPGELIGFDILDNHIHNCTGIALETSTICIFNLGELNKICVKMQKLHNRLFSLMRHEITKTHIMLGLLAKGNPDQKLATFLVNLSDRLKARGSSSFIFDLTMSRYDIGSYLGLADETISRSFSKLREHLIIDAERKKITILDYDALRKLSGFDLKMSH